MKKQEFKLENIPKENIFKIPANYFEDLSDKIEFRTQSVVENLSKENIFKVPENYFENLTSRIESHTSAQSKIIPLAMWSKKKTWASVAACSAIAILGYFTLMPKQDSLGNESLLGVQNQEIVNYLIQENLNQGDFAEQINSTKILKFKDSELIDNLKVSDKDILQSVDYEDIDNEI